MQAMDLLAARSSNGKLSEPAPDPETLEAILRVALRAPDHGAVRPWRILLVRGTARERLGDLFAASLRRRTPEVTEEQLERARRKPLRAPLIMVVAATVREHPKAPEIEQVISAGTLAHGVLLGLQAQGFAGMWRTGAPAYDVEVKRGLGLHDSDHIVGFLYAGTPSQPAPEQRRPEPREIVEEWTGVTPEQA